MVKVFLLRQLAGEVEGGPLYLLCLGTGPMYIRLIGWRVFDLEMHVDEVHSRDELQLRGLPAAITSVEDLDGSK